MFDQHGLQTWPVPEAPKLVGVDKWETAKISSESSVGLLRRAPTYFGASHPGIEETRMVLVLLLNIL